jgi:hypothetical protein
LFIYKITCKNYAIQEFSSYLIAKSEINSSLDTQLPYTSNPGKYLATQKALIEIKPIEYGSPSLERFHPRKVL